MIAATVTLCFVILGLAAVISLRRVYRGPTILDRVIGYDAVTICIIGMMVLVSIQWETGHLIEIIMIFSLLGFMGTVAIVTYLNTVIPRQRLSSAAWREKKKERKNSEKV